MDYITCHKRHNRPRLHNTVCEAICKKYKQCPNYKEWYKAVNGKEMGADKLRKSRRRKKTF